LAGILSRPERSLLVFILTVSAYMVGNAAYLYASPPERSVLPAFYQWMLVSHVVAGVALIPALVVFILLHVRKALKLRNAKAAISGGGVAVASLALLATGFFLFERANSAENRWALRSHQILALAAPALYAAHRFFGRRRPARALVARGFAVPCAIFLASIAIHAATKPPIPPEPQAFVEKPPDGVDPWREAWPDYGAAGADPKSVFFPANTRSITGGFLKGTLLTNADVSDADTLKKDLDRYGFAVDAKIGSAQCERCHQDVVDQWSRSAHRYASFNNPFYRASVEALREEENGRVRSQWCAGCHDPAIMMAGNMTHDIKPDIPESQAGLTCLSCHRMDEVHGVGGNGNYRIADAAPSPYLFADAKSGIFAEVHDLLVKSKPDVHKRDMLKPVFRTSEYCGTCHKVSLDVPVNGYRWLRGQNEYDAHQDSGVSRNNARTFYLPEKARSCQDCHMPLVDAPLGDVSAKNGKVRSHLFLGPNTALPHIRGDERTLAEIAEFRKNRLRADVFAVKVERDGVETSYAAPDLRDVPLAAGETVEFQIVVRNKDVGHPFPGGTLDSNEAWIRFSVVDRDAPDETRFLSGAVDDETKRVDEEAHFYRVVFVDEHGREADRRNPQDFRAAVHLNVIGPGTADVVRYGVKVPDDFAGKRLRVKAEVLWRKFNRNYVEFAWNRVFPGKAPPDIPIDVIASAEAEFPVVAGKAPDPAPLSPEATQKDWVRFNDWGIGLLLQGDTKNAVVAFRSVADALPDRVDGWRNLARAAIDEGDNALALELLKKAEAVAPSNAQNAYFFGVVREKTGALDDAIAAFERAAEGFPNDRTIHQRLGQIRWKQGRFEEALLDNLRVLAIDPEDRTAHLQRMYIYRALGDEPAAAEAQKAYRRYQIDESAQQWTNEYRRSNPHVNLESRMVHVHVLPDLRE
jgi:tetratricopeptide (TPR) repeat protein